MTLPRDGKAVKWRDLHLRAIRRSARNPLAAAGSSAMPRTMHALPVAELKTVITDLCLAGRVWSTPQLCVVVDRPRVSSELLKAADDPAGSETRRLRDAHPGGRGIPRCRLGAGSLSGRRQVTVAVVNVTTIGRVTWLANWCLTSFSMSSSSPCLAAGVIICVLE